MWYPELKLNQINRICFVLCDNNYTEVAGLGGTFLYFISKNGGAFVAGTGAKAEIGNGWYTALLPAAECNTIGPVAIRTSAGGTIQQNLEYVVQQRNAGCIDYTYTVLDSVTFLPIPGVEVDVYTDLAMTALVWCGVTDAAGVARDSDGALPCLDAGTYYFKRNKPGYTFVNPDTEIVS